ncbi:MAG: hypothetical protein IJ809_01985 [Clostridia bacterium]|nr:hypothetical protein [Clostridia bacterium]
MRFFRRFLRKLEIRYIELFLKEFLPRAGLGKLYSIKCNNYKLGDYVITTSMNKYSMHLYECEKYNKIFEISIDNMNQEVVRFEISGFVFYEILPKNMIMIKNEKMQVVNLRNGKVRLFLKGEKAKLASFEFVQYKSKVISSKYVNIEKLIKVSKNVRRMHKS